MKKIPILHSEVYGLKNGPVVVLLHGYLASSRYWHQVAEQLSQNYRVIALDLLGFGQSPKPNLSKYDYKAHTASINATLDYLQINEPFTLVGHSMGALLALRYSREHASRVQKLVLANMPIFIDKREAKAEIFSTSLFYRLGLQPGLHDIIWPIFRLSSRLKLIPSSVGEGAATRSAYMFQSTGFSRLRSLRNVIFSSTIDDDLQALTVDTIMLNGTHDRPGYIKNLTNLKNTARLTIRTATGGHHLPHSNPEIISQVL